MTALNVPVPDFPWVGNYAPIAILFLAHMVIAQYSLGAITLAAPMELWAVRRGGDERGLRYARALANSYYLVFSLGATLAVFAVTMLVGLWGREVATLVNHFLPLIGVAMGLFIVLAPLLVWYRATFATMRPRRHVLLGFAVLFWQTLFLVCIVVVDADMMTPGAGGLLGGFTGVPAYWPLLIHRLLGNVSWTALFLAAYAGWRLVRSRDEQQRAYQSWAAGINLRIGVATALLMPPGGFVLVEVLKSYQPGFFDNLLRGQAAWLFVVQGALLGVVLVGGNVALALEDSTRAGAADGAVVVAVSAVAMAVALMPSQVIGEPILWVRYVAIGIAVAVTALHLVVRTLGYRPPRLATAPGAMRVLPFSVSRRARGALTCVGITAVVLSLFMGYIKDQARGQYATYGELTQQDARQQYQPSGIYP